MDQNTILIVVLAVAVIALIGFIVSQKKRSDNLHSTFGPEYHRAISESGGKGKAEAELLERQQRVKSASIRSLSLTDQERFTKSWADVQAEFVDDPERSIGHADTLVAEVMSARGYPVSDFEQMSADISVDHPGVVQNYRAAHEIAVRQGRGEANTEDLRQAMIHYRSLFEDLVHESEKQHRA